MEFFLLSVCKCFAVLCRGWFYLSIVVMCMHKLLQYWLNYKYNKNNKDTLMEFPRPCFSGVWLQAYNAEKRSTSVSPLWDARRLRKKTSLWLSSVASRSKCFKILFSDDILFPPDSAGWCASIQSYRAFTVCHFRGFRFEFRWRHRWIPIPMDHKTWRHLITLCARTFIAQTRSHWSSWGEYTIYFIRFMKALSMFCRFITSEWPNDCSTEAIWIFVLLKT